MLTLAERLTSGYGSCARGAAADDMITSHVFRKCLWYTTTSSTCKPLSLLLFCMNGHDADNEQKSLYSPTILDEQSRENDGELISPDLLSIVITTSPTPSAPSPELVKSVVDSLPLQLQKLHLIVTFDGYTICQSIKRTEGRLKRGQITQKLADVYPAYITNVQSLFGSTISECRFDKRMHAFVSSTQTGDRKVTFLRHKYRQGFAFNVKSALDYCTTPNVLILQHDWVFAAPHIPLKRLIDIMQSEQEVGYISFVARQSRRYAHTRGEFHLRNRAVFRASREIRCGRDLEDDLVACLHFFDRPHLCKVSLYEKVFSSGLIKRGDFIEDTLGTEYLTSIANSHDDAAAIHAWQEYKAWLYHPGDGDQVAIRHTSGRTCLAKDDQLARIQQYIHDGRAKKLVSMEM